jgi:hypothetical protein
MEVPEALAQTIVESWLAGTRWGQNDPLMNQQYIHFVKNALLQQNVWFSDQSDNQAGGDVAH